MITVSSLAATYSSAVTYNAATGTTTNSDAASTSATGTSTTANPSGKLSQAVTDKVTQALAPATAGIKQLNTSLTQGQTKLSALGQVQSAIADFQTLAKSLGGASTSTAGAAATPVTAADMKTRVESFAKAYNALSTKLQTLQSGDMKGDPGLAQVSAQMTQALRDAGGTSSTGALGKAGISLSGGQLKIDSTKLSAALAADPSAVGSLLSGGNGVADKLSSKLAALTTSGGAIGRETATTTKQISSIETQRASMTKVLTSTATALAAMYTQQEQAGTSSGGATSLFDMMG